MEIGEAVAVKLADYFLVVDVPRKNHIRSCHRPKLSMKRAVVIRAPCYHELALRSRLEERLSDEVGVVLRDQPARNEIVLIGLDTELVDERRIFR